MQTSEQHVLQPVHTNNLPDQARIAEQARTLSATNWGLFPALSVVSATGLLVVAIAFSAARSEFGWAETVFWAGLTLLFLPIFTRLLLPSPSRQERIGLVVTLGIGLYMVKLLHSPLLFTHHDEFFHWRTTSDILSSGRLFEPNPLLPVSSLHPGLESATAGLMSLTGLDLFVSGSILVGVARLVLVLSLFLTFEAVSNSPRIAGVAVAIYMTHPNFLYFNSMYKYESLAIAFATLAVCALVLRQRSQPTARSGLTVVAIVAILAVVITHHVTAYMLVALLLIWTLTSRFLRAYDENRPSPFRPMVLAAVASVAWLLFVADIVVGYIAPHLTGAVQEIIRIVSQEPGSGRQLFQSADPGAAIQTPLWERATAISAVGLLMIAIPLGFWMVWKHRRRSAIAVALAIATLSYPAGMALRFTGSGWEIGNRTSASVFVAVGLIAAFGIVGVWLSRNPGILRTTAVAACGVVFLFGGIIAGWPPDWRLPEPYVVGHAGTRSVEPQGIQAAEWSLQHLGPNHRMATDKMNHLLMGSIGQQQVQTSLSGAFDAEWMLYAPELNREVIEILQENDVQYVVLDWRIEDAPRIPQQYYPGTTIEAAFNKFEQIPGSARVFDSGDLVIYGLDMENAAIEVGDSDE